MPASRVLVASLVLAIAVSPGLAGKKSESVLEERIAALEEKIEAQQAAYERLLTEKFDALSKQLSSLEEKLAAASLNPADLDREAGVLLSQVNKSIQAGDFELAKQKMDELQKKYGDTNTARRAARIQQELAVFGKDAPADLGVEEWYQGQADLGNGKATLLVFWEVWCPHCKREVPKLEEIHEKYKDRGLQVVGLTRLTRSATPEGVRDFIAEHNVSYPMAKENGSTSSYFNVSGIPAAAVVKDGKIVWRGHPARLTTEMIEGWL